MPVFDLRDYIVFKSGTWQDATALGEETPFMFTLGDTLGAGRLVLRWPSDTVVLAGPLRVRITFQSENVTYAAGADPTFSAAGAASGSLLHLLGNAPTPQSGLSINPAAFGGLPSGVGGKTLQASTLYSYLLEIPPGQTWPFTFQEAAVVQQLGTNFRYRVLIENPFIDQALCVTQPTNDLPCDFAVANIPDSSRFFPAACEPCEGSVSIGLPPGATTLAIPVADGGCVRPRFFNGMFITREDLEAEQRYFRMKHRLKNRASGEGVVWGLNVGKQSAQVCVLPGYAVDCCGNDLTVTSVYKVDVATLVRDPAAAAALAGGAPKRMHLLLEYVECPGDPRPVHADPCGGPSRCEMSRIRESVRLRLVPPRDVELVGPLKGFLDRVKLLRTAYPLTPAPAQAGAPPLQTPFRINLTFTSANTADEGGGKSQIQIRPSPAGTPIGPFPRVSGIDIEISPDAAEVFAGGRLDVRGSDGTTIVNQLDFTGASLDFAPQKVSIPAPRAGVTYTYVLSGWSAEMLLAPENAPRISGTTTLTLAIDAASGVTGNVAQSPLQMVPTQLAPDCRREACQTDEEDPVLPVLPWLHTDPLYAKHAGDPKALILAALQAWLVQTMLRERAGTASAVWTARRKIASALYEGSWLLFYGIDSNSAAQSPAVDSLRKLFRSWCDDFIYTGPECKGPLHGAVIGCTTLQAGTLGDIDPFGGRRWVIHHPLIAHWMGTFGMAPLDVTASRMFSTICCLASVASPDKLPSRPVAAIRMGNSYLTFGTPSEVVARLREPDINLDVQQTQAVSVAEFIVKFIQATGSSSSGGPPATAVPALRTSVGNPFAEDVLSIVSPIDATTTQVPPREAVPVRTAPAPAAPAPAPATPTQPATPTRRGPT